MKSESSNLHAKVLALASRWNCLEETAILKIKNNNKILNALGGFQILHELDEILATSGESQKAIPEGDGDDDDEEFWSGLNRCGGDDDDEHNDDAAGDSQLGNLMKEVGESGDDCEDSLLQEHMHIESQESVDDGLVRIAIGDDDDEPQSPSPDDADCDRDGDDPSDDDEGDGEDLDGEPLDDAEMDDLALAAMDDDASDNDASVCEDDDSAGGSADEDDAAGGSADKHAYVGLEGKIVGVAQGLSTMRPTSRDDVCGATGGADDGKRAAGADAGKGAEVREMDDALSDEDEILTAPHGHADINSKTHRNSYMRMFRRLSGKKIARKRPKLVARFKDTNQRHQCFLDWFACEENMEDIKTKHAWSSKSLLVNKACLVMKSACWANKFETTHGWTFCCL